MEMLLIEDMKESEICAGVICKEDNNYYLEFDPKKYPSRPGLDQLKADEYYYIQWIKIVIETKERIPYRGNLKYLGNGRIEIPSQYIISPNDPRYGQFEVGESLFFIFEGLQK